MRFAKILSMVAMSLSVYGSEFNNENHRDNGVKFNNEGHWDSEGLNLEFDLIDNSVKPKNLKRKCLDKSGSDKPNSTKEYKRSRLFEKTFQGVSSQRVPEETEETSERIQFDDQQWDFIKRMQGDHDTEKRALEETIAFLATETRSLKETIALLDQQVHSLFYLGTVPSSIYRDLWEQGVQERQNYENKLDFFEQQHENELISIKQGFNKEINRLVNEEKRIYEGQIAFYKDKIAFLEQSLIDLSRSRQNDTTSTPLPVQEVIPNVSPGQGVIFKNLSQAEMRTLLLGGFKIRIPSFGGETITFKPESEKRIW
jgi:hypothetical protein